jgi:hypothetical protein
MPLISRDVPAFTNDDCDGSRPPALAIDGDYETQWRTCEGTPSAASPKWLAYDLSSVPPARRRNVVVAWFNDPTTSPFDHAVIGDIAYDSLADYTIEVNPARGGGSPPTSGWVTRAAVRGNTFNSRQHHLVGLARDNWIRIRVTRSDGSGENEDVSLNLDVQDASGGTRDDWLFLGDSITQDGLSHSVRVAASGQRVGTFSQLVHARRPAYFPLYQDGGIGGLASADGARLVPRFLRAFPGHFVVLAFGRNDANAGPGDPAMAGRFRRNLRSMIRDVLAAGKVPVVPTIPWGAIAHLRANVPVLNREIADVERQFPRVLHGPDLFGLFQRRPDLISGDGIHPTLEAGYAALRLAWPDWAAATVYGGGTTAGR